MPASWDDFARLCPLKYFFPNVNQEKLFWWRRNLCGENRVWWNITHATAIKLHFFKHWLSLSRTHTHTHAHTHAHLHKHATSVKQTSQPKRMLHLNEYQKKNSLVCINAFTWEWSEWERLTHTHSRTHAHTHVQTHFSKSRGSQEFSQQDRIKIK